MTALPGDHGLVGVRLALNHHAIDRNALARPDAHQHAGSYFPHRAGSFRSPFDDGGAFAFGGKKRLEIARRLGAASRLDIATDGEQHQHHGGGVEIDLLALLDGGENGIGVGGTDAEDDERRGGHASLYGLNPALAQIRLSENYERRRREDPQQQVNPGNQPGIGALNVPA